MTDGVEQVEIVVTSEWRAIDTVEVPVADEAGIRAELAAGRLPEIVAEQISANGAELFDWSVSR